MVQNFLKRNKKHIPTTTIEIFVIIITWEGATSGILLLMRA